jgi:hypothetical protein
MQAVNLATLIKTELIVCRSHRTTHYSGCCTSIVSLGYPGVTEMMFVHLVLTPAFAGVTGVAAAVFLIKGSPL